MKEWRKPALLVPIKGVKEMSAKLIALLTTDPTKDYVGMPEAEDFPAVEEMRDDDGVICCQDLQGPCDCDKGTALVEERQGGDPRDVFALCTGESQPGSGTASMLETPPEEVERILEEYDL